MIIRTFKRASKFIFSVSLLLLLEHLLFTYLYYVYSLNNIADSTLYYISAHSSYSSWSETSFVNGTAFIELLLFPLIHYFGLTYFACFFIFSFFSLLGIFKLFKIVLDINRFRVSNWYYLFLLPGLHFWTVAVGKDSLIFYAICSLLYCYYFKKKWFNYIIPMLLIGIIRFYIFAFIGVALFLSLLFLSKKIKIRGKIFLGLVFAVCIFLISPYFFKSINVDGVKSIAEQQQIIAAANMGGGGAIDLTNSNIIVKFLSYLFRPLIFEARNVQGLFAAFENIIWMVIFYKLFIGIKRKALFKDHETFFWFSFTSILTIALPAAYILSNLGIASRQKVMVIPFLFVTLFMIISYNNRQRKLNLKN